MGPSTDHIPVFDADNHMYEPIEALTKHLPTRHDGKIQLVQVGRRARIALRGHITDYIPNPTFEVIAAPGYAFSETPYRTFVQHHRDIQDTLAGFLFHGTFDRFPNLRVASVENGAEWVGDFLHRIAGSARREAKAFRTDPVEQFRRHVYVSPFWEEDVTELVELCGRDRVIYGSDYPHAEGLAEPRSFLDGLAAAGMDHALVQDIVHDNVLEFLGV